MKDKILDYLTERYESTGWKYINILDVRKKFGNDIAADLNELRDEGKIRRREGPNNPLIEIL